jgi:hypothetical protein
MKKKIEFEKMATIKLSADKIYEVINRELNIYNLLVKEERRAYLNLAKKLLVLDSNLHKKFCMWRQHVQFLEALKNNINLFPAAELWILFQETLIEYIKEGIRPVQKASIELLAAMILYNYDIEEADGIVEGIVSDFAESDNPYLKKLYIDFFVACCNLPYTIGWIEDKLFEPLIGVSKCAFKSVKLHILTAIPNIKYLLTDSDILEEVQTMLMNFMEEKSQEVVMKTDEMNLLLFKWKKDAQTAEGKEEQRQFDEERDLREEILKAKIKKNKALIEERKKKEEEEEQSNSWKNTLKPLSDHDPRRGRSSSKNRKSKRFGKGKGKIISNKTLGKPPKKLRSGTFSANSKFLTASNLQNNSSEENKEAGGKRNSTIGNSETPKKQGIASKNTKTTRDKSDALDVIKK